MEVFTTALFFVAAIPLVLSATSGISDMLLNVHAICAPDKNRPAVVYLSSDEPLAVTIKCKNDNSFNVSRVGTSEFFNTTVHYTGDSDAYCVFKENKSTSSHNVILLSYSTRMPVIYWENWTKLMLSRETVISSMNKLYVAVAVLRLDSVYGPYFERDLISKQIEWPMSRANHEITKKANSEVYEVDLEIAHSYGIEIVLDVYRVTCTYDKYKTDVDVDVGMIDSLKPRKQLETHLGHNASSSFSIEVQDVLGLPILDGEIQYSQKIRLVITMSPVSGITTEQGFKVLHCNAVGDGSIIKYPFLRSGCGDGYIIARNKGFITDNFVAKSPYFKTFRLYGSETVSFQCTFNTCDTPCNGDSCALSKILIRRKRDGNHSAGNKKAKEIKATDDQILTDRFKIMASGIEEVNPAQTSDHGLPNTSKIPITNTSGEVKKTINTDENSNAPAENVVKPVVEHDFIAKSNTYSIGLSKPANIARISTTRSVTKKHTTGLNVDQIGVIVGCSSFIVMLALFAGVFVYHLRQRNKVESKFKAYRIKDLDSSTCLLYNENT